MFDPQFRRRLRMAVRELRNELMKLERARLNFDVGFQFLIPMAECFSKMFEPNESEGDEGASSVTRDSEGQGMAR